MPLRISSVIPSDGSSANPLEVHSQIPAAVSLGPPVGVLMFQEVFSVLILSFLLVLLAKFIPELFLQESGHILCFLKKFVFKFFNGVICRYLSQDPSILYERKMQP